MDVRITKKGNVVADGVKYKAIPAYHAPGSACAHCAFDGPGFREACEAAPCVDTRRRQPGFVLQNQEVIFVPKETP